MTNSKSVITRCKEWLAKCNAATLMFVLAGGLFIALGVHRFYIRPERFGWLSLLGCAVAAFGAFWVLLIGDYVLNHARLVFIFWAVFTLAMAIIHPHFAVGLGCALWFITISQWRDEAAARRASVGKPSIGDLD